MSLFPEKKILRVFLVVMGLLVSILTKPFAYPPGDVTIIDARHYSNVLGEIRNYRVFLPPGYATSDDKRYPVIYFFHGWSQRYFGSSNPYGDFDKGDDNGGDNIANFVKDHEVIVVKADGYNRSPGESYYVRPYNVTPVETYRQFPIYFPELVEHIDAHYRTLADRNHRGISGLSMGGFMTFWIGGKYPHLLSAAGNFCGSPEFTVGPKDFPVEYRHLDMYKNYGGMNIRLHYGDKDFIRGYHADLNKVWPELIDNYSYKVFDAAHSTCGMGEMLGFILDTFDNPPPKPAQWHHTDVYPQFTVWDYTVMTDRAVAGFTTIENVDVRGFRSAVREFMPDGEYLPSVDVTIKTAPLYEKNQLYVINGMDMRTLQSSQRTVRSDNDGAIIIRVDGGPHEIGINRQTDKANLVVASHSVERARWATAGDEVTLNVQVLNKGMSPARKIRIDVSPMRSKATVTKQGPVIADIPVNGMANTTFSFKVSPDTIQAARFKVILRDDKKNEWTNFIELPLKRKHASIENFIIADGKTFTVAKSGVESETILLGRGNGDGIANPGESIILLVKDQDKLWRTDLTVNDPHVNPFGVNIRKSDYWGSFDYVGGSAKYDVPMISSHCPQNHPVEVLAEYWLPQYPLHIIKEGVIRFQIKGKDTTPPYIGTIQLTGDNVLQVKLYDGGKIRSVKATLVEKSEGKKSVSTMLTDDGRNGDRAESDFVFSQTIPSQVFGVFNVIIEAEDEFGNRAVHEVDQQYIVH